MSSIQGIEKLHQYLSSIQLEKITKAADRHAEQSNMSFYIISISETAMEIEVTQAETKSNTYATADTLKKRTQEMVKNFLPHTKLNIYPITFAPSPASLVTTSWLENKMQEKDVRIKQIAFDTGIDKQSISDWITGKKSMSQIVKAMFYFYFSK